jgi:hypothetical protein
MYERLHSMLARVSGCPTTNLTLCGSTLLSDSKRSLNRSRGNNRVFRKIFDLCGGLRSRESGFSLNPQPVHVDSDRFILGIDGGVWPRY